MTEEKLQNNFPMPSIFHISQYKAGSQWIYTMLSECFPDDIVIPKGEATQFLNEPIQQGKIYPTVYITKEQFESVQLPSNYHKFVIIRDLRDTLISLYFSFKISHEIMAPEMQEVRDRLVGLSLDDGLIYLIHYDLGIFKDYQLSWIGDEYLIRFEDLIVNDTKIFTRLLIDDFKLPLASERLCKVLKEVRFQNLANRERGVEDISSHFRKGIAGDWKNYFSPKVKQVFKDHFGDVLIKTGYEHDMNW